MQQLTRAYSCQSLKRNFNSCGEVALTSPLRWCDLALKINGDSPVHCSVTKALGTDLPDLIED